MSSAEVEYPAMWRLLERGRNLKVDDGVVVLLVGGGRPSPSPTQFWAPALLAPTEHAADNDDDMLGCDHDQ